MFIYKPNLNQFEAGASERLPALDPTVDEGLVIIGTAGREQVSRS
jgi:hypothetical protein